jgi:hypothetical protein
VFESTDETIAHCRAHPHDEDAYGWLARIIGDDEPGDPRILELVQPLVGLGQSETVRLIVGETLENSEFPEAALDWYSGESEPELLSRVRCLHTLGRLDEALALYRAAANRYPSAVLPPPSPEDNWEYPPWRTWVISQMPAAQLRGRPRFNCQRTR